MERKQYQSLDIMKFICALLIIDIHTATFASSSTLLYTLFRHVIDVVAVPLFFISDGFLFFRKIQSLSTPKEKNRAYLTYAGRLLRMYLIYTVVYFPFVLYGWLSAGGITQENLLAYLKRFVFEGSYATIWFLPALLTAVTVVFLLSKWLRPIGVVLVSLPFYLFAVLASSYYGAVSRLPVLGAVFNTYYSFFDTVKNGLLFGFLFVAVGACFASSSRTWNIKWPVCLSIIVLWGAMGVEALVQWKLGWASKGVDTNLLLVPLTCALFVFVLGAQEKWGKKLAAHSKLCVHLRKLSVLLFLLQRIFLTLYDMFGWSQMHSMLWTLLILGSTTLLSEGIIWLSKKWKPAAYLY